MAMGQPRYPSASAARNLRSCHRVVHRLGSLGRQHTGHCTGQRWTLEASSAYREVKEQLPCTFSTGTAAAGTLRNCTVTLSKTAVVWAAALVCTCAATRTHRHTSMIKFRTSFSFVSTKNGTTCLFRQLAHEEIFAIMDVHHYSRRNMTDPHEKEVPAWDAPLPQPETIPVWDAPLPPPETIPAWNAPLPPPETIPAWNAPLPALHVSPLFKRLSSGLPTQPNHNHETLAFGRTSSRIRSHAA